MGQKVNPNGLRFGINKDWQSRWIAKDGKQVSKWLVEDEKVRKFFLKTYKNSQISHIEIERQQNTIDVFVHCSQPGIVLGKEAVNLKTIKKQINLIVGRNIKVNVNVLAIEKPALSARIIAREIADAIENRVSFRNAQKMAIKKVLMNGAKGIRTHVSGRLGGVEMAREEGYSEGIVPLTTLRADIDYSLEEALTTYGLIGVKVWINRGEIFTQDVNNKVSKSTNFKMGGSSQNSEKKPKEFRKTDKAEKSDQDVTASLDAKVSSKEDE